MVDAVYRIKWTEFERGWGQRDAGTTYYDTLEEAQAVIDKHYASLYMRTCSQPDGPVPDTYIHPSSPKLVENPQ